MNYPRIFERVYCQPLCVTAARFQSIHSFLLPRLSGQIPFEVALAPAAADGQQPPARGTRNPFTGKRVQKAGPGWKADGTLDPRFYTEAAPGIAVVPIYGALAKNLSSWEEACGGGTDINAPQEALRQAVAAPDIGTIILDIDSPGGEVTGIPEFGAAVRAAAQAKPVYAFTDASMCSAAYWLGSQASEIYATGSSNVGSIGTYLAWLDPAVKMELEGIKLQFFAEGKHKGIGLPGRPLTAEDEALLRGRVKQINDLFQSAVTGARPQVEAPTMEGQTFSGLDLVNTGLVDGLVSSWDELLSLIAA
jgi:ClpP class serine protease